ncbi:Outer membrane efflux protein [Planctomycetes bacterium Poly30]|uniref:Outer membrane efflux protein n=1 Tax=Saltatorellus ferox TaxID=2528018 RepID=A0A518EY78_9BACT|nr:Outer membrane efflux protein [Planctomycetes bacterium Poly30]
MSRLEIFTKRRGTSAALCLLVASCVSAEDARRVRPGARPAPMRVLPDDALLDRFGRTDAQKGESAVAVIGSVLPPSAAADESEAPLPPLTFDEVLRSVEEQFPLILAALQEVEIANAQMLSAEGGFDLRIKGDGAVAPDGFYRNETAKVLIEQPTTAWGATPFAGYKIGTGDFPIWEGGLKSNEEGEFSAGIRLPLLKGREIDQRRLDLWRARVGQAQAEPMVLEKRLEATRKAALSYWKWVAAGQKLGIARRLLDLAENRQEGIVISVDEGQLPQLSITENRRLVVERQSIVIRSERALQEAAIALSLFWRSSAGQPVIPLEAQLPESLPTPTDPALFLGDADHELALRNRPEVRSLELLSDQIRLDVAKAENDLLPKLDLTVAGSKDVGDAVSSPDDKGPFELDVFVNFDVPVQRREASGKLRSLDAKAIQVERKLQFARESIIAEVQDGQSAVLQTWLRLAQVRENALLAGQLEEAERIFLAEGQSDLLRVNLREQQTASAASMLVDVIAEHFRAVADYRASLGIPYDEVLR